MTSRMEIAIGAVFIAVIVGVVLLALLIGLYWLLKKRRHN